MKKKFFPKYGQNLRLLRALTVLTIFFSLVLPPSIQAEMESPNYRIEGEEVAPAGQAEASSNYSVWETIGHWVSDTLQGINYMVKGGPVEQIQANVPGQPAFTNEAQWYNKLKFIINNGENPTDATLAIAITDDDWVTIRYIQADDTIGDSMVWQTYTNWGGASGEIVTGLAPGTAYKIKVKAERGDFTESAFGPEAQAQTVEAQITFDLDTGPTHGDSDAPYNIDLGGLNFSSITTAGDRIYLDLETNAEEGAVIQIKDANNGLKSAASDPDYTIQSASEELQVSQNTNDGYGLQNGSWSASSGSWTESGTFDLSGNNVGEVSTAWNELANTTSDPIFGGSGEIYILAVAAKATPAEDDYSDTVTFRATATF